MIRHRAAVPGARVEIGPTKFFLCSPTEESNILRGQFRDVLGSPPKGAAGSLHAPCSNDRPIGEPQKSSFGEHKIGPDDIAINLRRNFFNRTRCAFSWGWSHEAHVAARVER
jgi:hypothetical protein